MFHVTSSYVFICVIFLIVSLSSHACIYIYIYVCGFLKLTNLSKLIFGKFFLKKIGRFYTCVCGSLKLAG